MVGREEVANLGYYQRTPIRAPPGPRPLPILKNSLQIPTNANELYLKLREWKDEFGKSTANMSGSVES